MKAIEQTHVDAVEEPSVDINSTVSVEGVEQLHDSLHEMADTIDVTGFKCVKCGLVHKHDTTKHRLSDDFDISEDDAASMDFNPVCHCGLQEAGRHGADYGLDEDRAASTASQAPIPPEASRKMNEVYGIL